MRATKPDSRAESNEGRMKFDDKEMLAKLLPNEYYEYITTGIYPLEGIINVQKEEHIFPATDK
jgi:hypothetical protein